MALLRIQTCHQRQQAAFGRITHAHILSRPQTLFDSDVFPSRPSDSRQYAAAATKSTARPCPDLVGDDARFARYLRDLSPYARFVKRRGPRTGDIVIQDVVLLYRIDQNLATSLVHHEDFPLQHGQSMPCASYVEIKQRTSFPAACLIASRMTVKELMVSSREKAEQRSAYYRAED